MHHRSSGFDDFMVTGCISLGRNLYVFLDAIIREKCWKALADGHELKI
jgi:hypothetical protein